jgi:hypothetical protein
MKFLSILSRSMCVTIDGVWMDGWIFDNLHSLLETTSKYSVTTNLYNSRITTAPAKPFPSLLCLHLVQVQAQRPAIVTEIVCGFPQSLQTKAYSRTVPEIRPRLLPSIAFTTHYLLLTKNEAESVLLCR